MDLQLFSTDTIVTSTFGFLKKTDKNIIDAIPSIYAPINSPEFTGTPTAPTASPDTATTQIANTAFVNNLIATKQNVNAALTSISSLTTSANKMIYTTDINTYAVTDLSEFSRNLLGITNAEDFMDAIGISDAAVASAVTDSLGNNIAATYTPKPTANVTTLPSSGWSLDTSNSGYKYYYVISSPGVTSSDIATIVIDSGSQSMASDIGLCPLNETITDGIRLRTNVQPLSPISITYYILKGN